MERPVVMIDASSRGAVHIVTDGLAELTVPNDCAK